jgi:hypothetical protein
MAIMWDPPAERPSLEPTPAELAWKHWLVQALTTKSDEPPSPAPAEATQEVKPAA